MIPIETPSAFALRINKFDFGFVFPMDLISHANF